MKTTIQENINREIEVFSILKHPRVEYTLLLSINRIFYEKYHARP